MLVAEHEKVSHNPAGRWIAVVRYFVAVPMLRGWVTAAVFPPWSSVRARPGPRMSPQSEAYQGPPVFGCRGSTGRRRLKLPLRSQAAAGALEHQIIGTPPGTGRGDLLGQEPGERDRSLLARLGRVEGQPAVVLGHRPGDEHAPAQRD